MPDTNLIDDITALTGAVNFDALCIGDGVTDDTLALQNTVTANPGRRIVGTKPCLIKNAYFADQDLDLRLNLVQAPGQRIMQVKRTPGATYAVSAITRQQFGATNTPLPSAALTVNKIACASAWTFASDDAVLMYSQDIYPWSTQFSADLGYGINVYQGESFRLLGVGQDYTGRANGGFVQGDIVTGATSGATAIVLNDMMNGSYAGATFTPTSPGGVALRSMSGAFTDGENLTVAGQLRGVASGAAYLLTSHVLNQTYTNSVLIRKMGTAKLNLELTLDTQTDPENMIGSAQRYEQLLLIGCVDPRVRVTTVRSYTRSIRIQSCIGHDVDQKIGRLPNNANPSEGAYGYGTELCGMSSYGTVKVNGKSMRHAFTTNCDGLATGVAYDATAFYYQGSQRCNVVRDSMVYSAKAEPFDTHPGDEDTLFINCIAMAPNGGALAVTAPGGFKTRGFRTRMMNCHNFGGRIGFNDYAGVFNAGFDHVNEYEGCSSMGHSDRGFFVSNAPYSRTQHRVVWRNCRSGGNQTSLSTPYYTYAFDAMNGNDVSLIDCYASGFAGAPFTIRSDTAWDIVNLKIDYRDCAATATEGRVEGIPARVSISEIYSIRSANNQPQSSLRNTTSSAIQVEMRGTVVTEAGFATRVPLTRDTGGGTLTVRYKENGKWVYPQSAAPTAGAHNPGDRTVDPAPAAGGQMGFVCTTAGTPGTWKAYGAIGA